MEKNWGVYVGFGVYVSAEESIEGLIQMLYSIGKLWGLRILVIKEKETGANEKVGSLSELEDVLDTVELYETVVLSPFRINEELARTIVYELDLVS